MRAARYRRLDIAEPLAQQGFELCRRATRRTGEIEYATTLLLPLRLRVALWSLYGAARTIDDLAEDDSDRTGAAERLDAWNREFQRDLRRGRSDDPVRAALLHTVRGWDLPPDWLRSVFEGQLADTTGREFATWDDWYDYVAMVNAPFVIQTASMLVQNAGLSVSLRQDAGTLDVWQNLARAVNLTDALADLGEDGARHRIRLPAEVLDRFGVPPRDLLTGRSSAALQAMVHHLTGTARTWFDNSPQLPPVLHPAIGTALTCYLDLHRLLLDTVDERAAALPRHRLTISRRRSRRLLLTARATTALAWALFPSPLGDLSLPPPAPAAPASLPATPATLPDDPPTGGPPRHVAVIMDGNGRWAAARGLQRDHGHRAGMKALNDVVDAAHELGVRYLTVYAFSTENWRRPAAEVNTLLHALPRELLRDSAATWHQRGVRVRWAGQRAGLPLDLVSVLTSMTERTRHNSALTLTLCLNYGGRAELTAAAGRLATEAAAGRLDPRTLSEADLAAHLHLADLPDVDLLLRTGGEHRLSNFLPWQSVYAELMFLDTPWPEFDRRALRDAVEAYARRSRRYGAVPRPDPAP
ncbi:polyprenyl diphosphate synthase [Kitasatospora sp. NPDC089797]|uniref:polyprenyl diphosphate synthase n=1 Tax=Kitasatospora sp. NPDC089797 TaxID=3155298 RepID=UPI0034345CA7